MGHLLLFLISKHMAFVGKIWMKRITLATFEFSPFVELVAKTVHSGFLLKETHTTGPTR